jgi:phosphoserine phosphatase
VDLGEEPALASWPAAARGPLSALLNRFDHTTPASYAVFDADETIWRHDLEEALLPYLEAQGRIRLDESKAGELPISPYPGESLTSYYLRLCDIDESLGFLWLGQAFSGLSLAELRSAVRAMMAGRVPLHTTRSGPGGPQPLEIGVPEIYRQQAELIHALQAHGIEVYVVTACLEELARFVLSDPEYGVGVPPENVVGLRMLLRRPDGSVVPGWPDAKRADAVAPTEWLSEERLELRLTPFVAAIPTWHSGKVAAIKARIDPTLRPVLVAGDSRSDLYMLMYAGASSGGARLFIRRSPEHAQMLQSAIAQRELTSGWPSAADPAPELGWIQVGANELTTLPPPAPRAVRAAD